MDQTINPGFQHVAEKILLNLPFKDLMAFQLVNKSSKEILDIILDNPKFWIKYWLKGLSKKNKADWIKAIHLTKNTNLSKILLLYIKKVLRRDRIVDMPCYINEKIVDKFTDITDENGRLTDPCKGDSGGPLAVRHNREWQLVGVLKGEG